MPRRSPGGTAQSTLHQHRPLEDPFFVSLGPIRGNHRRSMARRYLVDPLPAAGTAKLSGAVAHHLARVVRVRVDDQIRLFDGRGSELDATVVATSSSSLTLQCTPPEAITRGLIAPIHLAFAPPKGPRADWLFEHATEVGAAAFWPLVTARSAVRSAVRNRAGSAGSGSGGSQSARAGEEVDKSAKRVERWRRIVAAASGQCDRSHIPHVHPVRTLSDWLTTASEELPRTRWVATGSDSPPLPTAGGGRDPQPAVLLTGPEGGLTSEEIDLAIQAGFAPCSLGPLTLRAETAALAGLVRLASGV